MARAAAEPEARASAPVATAVAAAAAAEVEASDARSDAQRLDLIEIMGHYRDEVCACRDRACVSGLEARYESLVGHASLPRSPGSHERYAEASQAAAHCIAAALANDP